MQMYLYMKGLPSAYELEHLARVFFLKSIPCKTYAQIRNEDAVYARCGKFHLAVGLRRAGQVFIRVQKFGGLPSEKKMALSQMLYHFLCEQTGLRPPWGMLTGVRPVRLLRKKTQELGQEAAVHLLQNQYAVSKEKLVLAKTILDVQKPFLQKLNANDISLYISIPFCPTRCSYCSFVSQSIEKEGALLPAYLEQLEEELFLTAELVKNQGLCLRCIYVGGGTPAVLSAVQLDRLLHVVQSHFDLSSLWEYTVEVGRADCTDFEKLAIIKSYGVERVSVNPQSMTPAVLSAIGRKHTPKEVLCCVEDVRKAGISCLNMDLIAGLPGENEKSFAKSLQETLSCSPENLTLHTLTLKRASYLAQSDQCGREAEGMLHYAYEQLFAHG